MVYLGHAFLNIALLYLCWYTTKSGLEQVKVGLTFNTLKMRVWMFWSSTENSIMKLEKEYGLKLVLKISYLQLLIPWSCIGCIPFGFSTTGNKLVVTKSTYCLELFGWKEKGEDVEVEWDSAESTKAVQDSLLAHKGCKCKTSDDNNRCRCVKKGDLCGPGCNCINCENKEKMGRSNYIKKYCFILKLRPSMDLCRATGSN